MGMTLNDWAGYFGVSASIYAMFVYVERTVNEDLVREFGKSLATSSWSAVFTDARRAYISWFDSLYQVKHRFSRFPRVSFWRSAFITSMLTPLFFLLLIEDFTSTWDSLGASVSILGSIALMALLFNSLFDFVSVTQTRFVGRLIARSTAISAVGFILLDALMTTVIAFVVAYLSIGGVLATHACISQPHEFGECIGSFVSIKDEFFQSPSEIPLFVSFVIEGDDDIVFGNVFSSISRAAFITTITTSAWLWLFLLGSGVARLVSKLESVRHLISNRLENHPGEILGGLAVVIWTTVFFAAKLT